MIASAAHLIFSPSVLDLLVQTVSMSVQALVYIVVASLVLSLLIHQFFKPESVFRKGFEFFFSVFWMLPSLLFVFMTWKSLRGLGLEDWLYSLKAVQTAWVLGFTPYVTLGLLKILSDLDLRHTEAARTLGARSTQVWLTLYWPRISTALASLSIHAFWMMLTSFSVVVILGGGSPKDTLETAIYQSVRFYEVQFDRALALAFWQVALMSFLLVLRKRLFLKAQKTGWEWSANPSDQDVKSHFALGWSILILALIAFVSSVVANPVLALELLMPFVQSMAIAVLVSGLTFALSFLCFRFARPLAEWGALMSPMMFSLLIWEGFGQVLPGWALCVLVQAVLFLPWITRSLFPLLERKRVQEFEAAKTLGASAIQAWLTVEWPRLSNELKKMTVWLIALSMGEVSSVILFSRGNFEPLGVWVQNQFSRFRMEEGFVGIQWILFTSLVLMVWAYFPLFKFRRSRT